MRWLPTRRWRCCWTGSTCTSQRRGLCQGCCQARMRAAPSPKKQKCACTQTQRLTIHHHSAPTQTFSLARTHAAPGGQRAQQAAAAGLPAAAGAEQRGVRTRLQEVLAGLPQPLGPRCAAAQGSTPTSPRTCRLAPPLSLGLRIVEGPARLLPAGDRGPAAQNARPHHLTHTAWPQPTCAPHPFVSWQVAADLLALKREGLILSLHSNAPDPRGGLVRRPGRAVPVPCHALPRRATALRSCAKQLAPAGPASPLSPPPSPAPPPAPPPLPHLCS